MDHDSRAALDRALKYLSSRWRTKKELQDKLLRDFPVDEAEFAVAECERLGFLNDRQYAKDYGAILASRGCGKYRIRFQMKRKGLAEKDADEVLTELAESEIERAIEAAAFKLKLLTREKDKRKKAEKLYRFLVCRGFDGETTRIAMENVLKLSLEDGVDW